MKPRTIIVLIAAIVALNLGVLGVVIFRRSNAVANSPVVGPPTAAKMTPVSGTITQAAASAPGPGTAAHARPAPPPVESGLHLDRQTVTASGNLRVQYLRDRKVGKKEIVLQDAHSAANSAVLAQYRGTAWVVASPDDEWVALNMRGQDAAEPQLYHRTSASPLKYDLVQTANGQSAIIADVVWQSYLDETKQEAGLDRHRVTIDATGWDPGSRELTLAVTPKPGKGDAAPPQAWTCVYNVATSQLETNAPAEEPNDGATSASSGPEEQTAAAPADNTDGQTAETNAGDLEGEKYPATRQDKITVPEANELSLAEVRYAMDEMFARHGVDFKDAKLRKTFSQFDWYQPRPGVNAEEAEKDFSPLEKDNLAVLRRVRDAKSKIAKHPQALKGQQVQQPPEQTTGQRFLRSVLQGVSDAVNNNGNGNGN